MQKIVLFLPAFYLVFDALGQKADSTITPANKEFRAKEKAYFYSLGNQQVALKITEYSDNKNIVMIALHNDETTSVKAARTILKETGGTLITIEHNSERYITFTRNKKTFRFDPNRIFTKTGIKAALHKQNKHRIDAAIGVVNGFARFVLGKIPPADVIIALHNNDDKGLSVVSYQQGGALRKDAAAVNKSNAHDPDNFFLTTDRRLFRSLAAAGYNVVLQHNKRAKDDGSLSIYYGRRNRQYINIEAEAGKSNEQRIMIEAVVAMLTGQ